MATSKTKALLGNYKAYYLLNICGTYKVNQSFAINMAIYNLPDKDFVQYRAVRSNNNPALTNEYISTMEPARLWVSANYTF